MSNLCALCQKSPGVFSCVCGIVPYCGITCQKTDWKRHRTSCPPYRIEETPGKGNGMVATRNLKAGKIIITEIPLAYVDGDNMQTKIEKVVKMSKTIPEGEKKKILTLYDPGEDDKRTFIVALKKAGALNKETLKFVKIFTSNSITVCANHDEFGINSSAVYANISRINHSCSPNCVWSWKKDDLYAKEVRAIKDIKKGEEIVASYIGEDEFISRKERREILYKRWNFDCNCKVCSLEGEDLRINEQHRSEIRKYHEKVPHLSLSGDISGALEIAKKKLNLMKVIEDEIIAQMPQAFLELYELSSIRSYKQCSSKVKISDKEKRKLEEEANEYKIQAATLATKFGDCFLYNYEKKRKEFLV